MSDEQTGGALEGTLTGGLGSSDPGQNAMGASRQFSLDLQNSFKDAQNAGKINFTMEKKGGEEPMVKAEMPAAVMTKIQDILKNYEHIEASYAQEIAENKNREEQVRRNPLMNVLTQVSAQLAQGKRNPDWVQALGRASQALNPTADQLRQQRMGMEQGLLGVLSSEKGLMQEEIAMEREGRLEQKAQRDAVTTANKEQLSYYNDAMKGAMKGEFVGDPFEKMQVAAGADPDVAHARREELEGIANKAALDNIRKEKAAVELAGQKENARLKEIDAQGKNMIAAINARAELSDTKSKDAASKTATKEELQAYTSKVKDKLEAAGELETDTKKLRIMLEQRDKLIGQFVGKVVPTYILKQRADIEFQAFTQMNAIRGMIGAGARFWNPTEYQNLSPKLVQINKPTDVNLAIVDETEKFIRNNRQWIVNTNPDVNWDHPKRQVALGTDGPDVVKAWHGAMADVAGGTTPPSQATIPKEIKDVAASGAQDGKTRYLQGKGKIYTVVNGIVTGVQDAK